jgi:hypothetical protein
MSQDYFWRYRLAPDVTEVYTVLRYRYDGKVYAFTERKEILDFLGEIDTEAELCVWLTTQSPFLRWRDAESYRRTYKAFHIRFVADNPVDCLRYIDTETFNSGGERISSRHIGSFERKGCIPALP